MGGNPQQHTPTVAPQALRVRVGLTDAYASGELVRGARWKAAAHFPPRELTIDELAAHVLGGGTIAVGTYAPGEVHFKDGQSAQVDGHRSKGDFVDAQLLLLDFDDAAGVDVARALAHPLIGPYAAIVHPSKSSTPEQPRTHVIFVLDRPITDGAEHELLTAALLKACADLQPDPACKDCARMFHGSTKPGAVVRHRLLPVAILEDLAADIRAEQQRLEAERLAAAARRMPAVGTRAERYAQAAYDRILQAVASAPNGARNETLYNQALSGFRKVFGGWPGFDAARLRANLLAIAQTWGAEEAHKAESTLAGAERAARAKPEEMRLDPTPSHRQARQTSRRMDKAPAVTTVTPAAMSGADSPAATRGAGEAQAEDCAMPEPPTFDELGPLDDPGEPPPGAEDGGDLWIDEPPPGAPADLEAELLERLQAFPADQYCDQPYVDTLGLLGPGAGVLILRSDVATGKTAAAIAEAQRMVEMGGRALYLTHRRQLAKDFTRRARKAGLDIHHYRDVRTTDQLRQLPGSLAACIDTFVTLADGHALPRFNLLIVDELDQLLAHVYEAGTLRERGPLAGDVLARLIRNTPRVLTFDAHASATAIDYLREQRPEDVRAVDNLHHAPRGALTLYEHRGALIDELPALIERAGAPVAVMCASEAEAELLGAQWAAQLGGGQVLALTADNAGQPRQNAFLADPNGQAAQYRVIFASPVLGTGFDIQAPVGAVVLLDQGAHLTAWDLRQMVGRWRKASTVHAYVRAGSAELDPALFDPAALTASYQATDAYNAQLLLTGQMDEDGRNLPPPRLVEYTRWHSRLLAARNASKALARAHFIQLAEGYSLTLNTNRQDPEAAAARAALRKAHDELLRTLALTAPPVDEAAWARLQEDGLITDEHRAGLKRHQIEDLTGAPITEGLRDLLWTARARARLNAIADQIDVWTALQAADRGEALAGVPYHQRSHRALRRALGARFVGRFVDLKTGAIQPLLEAADVGALAAELRSEPATMAALHRFCHRHLPNTDRGLIGAALRVFGLQLITKRTGEAKISRYTLDPATTAGWIELGRAVVARREQQRASEEAEASQLLRTAHLDQGGAQKLSALLQLDRAAAGVVENVRHGAQTLPDRPYFDLIDLARPLASVTAA